VAVLYLLVGAFLVIAAPQYVGGPMPEVDALSIVLPVVGIVSVIVGFAWMIRIYREKPEPDHRAWRYRSRR